MFPAFGERFWGELVVTCVGENVNFELSVWFDSQSWSPGTTPVAALSLVLMRSWNELPAVIEPKKTPPFPSPVPFTKMAMPLLWQ
jgi:hypothetical protein